ncbi:MAG: right-handed parallel beta-helix repeat-containing protein, partial [Saprospiraceae bacterium]
MRYFIPFIALLSTYLPSTAQIFVKQDATGILDGTSWANAYTDLQKAIDGSNPGDQIWIAAGTYFPKGPTPDSSHFLVVKPVEIYGGFTGNETSLSERNWVDN